MYDSALTGSVTIVDGEATGDSSSKDAEKGEQKAAIGVRPEQYGEQVGPDRRDDESCALSLPFFFFFLLSFFRFCLL